MSTRPVSTNGSTSAAQIHPPTQVSWYYKRRKYSYSVATIVMRVENNSHAEALGRNGRRYAPHLSYLPVTREIDLPACHYQIAFTSKFQKPSYER